ncbi:Parathyroid hormone-related protein [Channa argus]|uniref:Parathyroid hormone-related protein n=2 Tax=Channa argus TaxID=215402 RepID=A0A6G1PJR1_CHAAH|nr:Parathyroid hormone-related protein [Channa argus]
MTLTLLLKRLSVNRVLIVLELQKMQTSHRPVQLLAVMLLVTFTTGQCQQSQSRRAVTEHQLMHDRGRNIQSLKRLIWLSSAIEGLHTAQTRATASKPTKVLNLALNPALVPAAESPPPARVQSLLRDFFNPYLTHLPDREP